MSGPERELTCRHAAYLREAGISDAIVTAVGVYSVTDVAALPPEFTKYGSAVVPAIVFPWNDGAAPVLRPDTPWVDPRDASDVRKYITAKDAKPALWQTPATGGDTMLLVEGVKQTLAAASAAPDGATIVGMNGAWGWRERPDDDTSVPIADLAQAEGKDVVVVLDADAASNHSVYDAGAGLEVALKLEGAHSVRFPRLPAGRTTGLDDVLASRPLERRRDYLARMIAQSKPKPADRRPKPRATADKDAVVLPPPTAPLDVARIVMRRYVHGDRLTLRHWRGEWMRWRGPHWAAMEDRELARTLYRLTERAVFEQNGQVLPWSPTKHKVADVADALASATLLRRDVDAPSWLDGEQRPTTVACANELLDVATRTLRPHDPAYFNLVSVPFDYDADAPEPTQWLAFLGQLWPDDPDSIALLQQWFGYVLSGRTDLQKAPLIVGPPRSGKGTVGRILGRLVGKGSHVGPTLASLGREFGLQTLIGKSLAVIADVRLGGRTDVHTIVERILAITGEDTLSVPRKFREDWTGKLPTRLMLLSNEVPGFTDASAAIASRFVVLVQTQSWLGREDTTLEPRLIAELPGILNWALDGLDALAEAGSFTEPESSREARVKLVDGASPESAFVREECAVGPGLTIAPEMLFKAWREWCEDNGRKHPGTLQSFSRRLHAVVPTVETVRRRVNGKRVRELQGITLEDLLTRSEKAARSATDSEVGTPHEGVGRDRPRATTLHAHEKTHVSTNGETQTRSPTSDHSMVGRGPSRPGGSPPTIHRRRTAPPIPPLHRAAATSAHASSVARRSRGARASAPPSVVTARADIGTASSGSAQPSSTVVRHDWSR